MGPILNQGPSTLGTIPTYNSKIPAPNSFILHIERAYDVHEVLLTQRAPLKLRVVKTCLSLGSDKSVVEKVQFDSPTLAIACHWGVMSGSSQTSLESGCMSATKYSKVSVLNHAAYGNKT